MSVRRAQQEIDAVEFAGWMAFYAIEPWGESRADLRMGILASVQANIWRGKDSQPFGASDFIPDFDAGYDQPTEDELDALIEQQERMMEAVAVNMGGTVTNGLAET